MDQDKEEPATELTDDWNTFDESIFTEALNNQLKILDKSAEGFIKSLTETKPKRVQTQQGSSSTPHKLQTNPQTQTQQQAAINKAAKYKLSHQSRKCKFDSSKQDNSQASAPKVEVLAQQQNKKYPPTNNYQKQQPSIVPPIPDCLAANLPQPHTEDKALASMLMAWYMAGYHTGHYEATKRNKPQAN